MENGLALLLIIEGRCATKAMRYDNLNPWWEVPTQPPYVLPCDSELVRRYNEKHSVEKYRLHLNVLPEPFIGTENAPVVLLNLNPGFDDRDPVDHMRGEFQNLLRNNYRHCCSEFPFYSLDPRFENGGRKWWGKKLRPLIDICGRQKVSRSLLCIEFFPYHSRRFGNGSFRVPSQQYGFRLAHLAIDRGAIIIVMRCKSLWTEEIPQLETYSPMCVLNSPQNVVVSPRNCKLFDSVVSIICGGSSDV
jgi:hypothetical protein